MLSGQYTDQLDIYGQTVWVDLPLAEKISGIAKQSENWLDFVTGCDQYNYKIIVNPNGTYSVSSIPESLLNSTDLRNLLGKKSRQSFWNIKSRKGFPDPVYSKNGIELWQKSEVEEYINK
jgi:predicted DNA-binding transcriptional regulator AlpA